MQPEIAELKNRYGQLRAQLAQVGLDQPGICSEPGTRRRGGACYQWTRKVKAKTVSVALSKEQYLTLQEAINNWKELERILHQMQVLSRQMIFQTLPNPHAANASERKF